MEHPSTHSTYSPPIASKATRWPFSRRDGLSTTNASHRREMNSRKRLRQKAEPRVRPGTLRILTTKKTEAGRAIRFHRHLVSARRTRVRPRAGRRRAIMPPNRSRHFPRGNCFQGTAAAARHRRKLAGPIPSVKFKKRRWDSAGPLAQGFRCELAISVRLHRHLQLIAAAQPGRAWKNRHEHVRAAQMLGKNATMAIASLLAATAKSIPAAFSRVKLRRSRHRFRGRLPRVILCARQGSPPATLSEYARRRNGPPESSEVEVSNRQKKMSPREAAPPSRSKAPSGLGTAGLREITRCNGAARSGQPQHPGCVRTQSSPGGQVPYYKHGALNSPQAGSFRSLFYCSTLTRSSQTT